MADRNFSSGNTNDKTGNPVWTLLKRLYWIPVALFWILVWQILYMAVRKDLLLASPAAVFSSLVRLSGTAEFWKDCLFSLLRIQTGYLAGVLIGTLLAVVTVQSKWIHRFVYPVISAIRSTPVASFIILALVWMSNEKVVIFIVFLMVFPIVWTNVSEGIIKTDRQLLEMAKVFHISRGQTLRYIRVPSVLPFFVTSATTGLGLAWKAGIAAEVLSTPSFSLGTKLYEAKIYLETPDLLAFTIVIVIISLLLEKLLVVILKKSGVYFRKHGRYGMPGNMPASDSNTQTGRGASVK